MLRRILNRLKTNFKLLALLIVIFGFLLIAFPKVSNFSGVEPLQLTQGKVPFLFKFGNSLDFYGGSEFIFNISNKDLTVSEREKLLTEFEYRLRKLGLSGYEVFIRGNSEQLQLVARIPVEFSEDPLLARILALKGDVSFTVPTQASDDSPPDASQQTLIPTTLTKTDLEAVNVTYGAETGGYGLVLDFKDESVSQLLIYAASDINSSAAGLVLQLDGSSIAGQAVLYSSSSQNGKITFATGVGNDSHAANLIKDLLLAEPLSQTLNFNSSDSKALAGKYDPLSNIFKLILSVMGIIWLGLKLSKQKVLGLVVVTNLAFIVLGSISLLKILNFPVTLLGLVGIVLAVAIWARHTRSLLPVVSLSEHTTLKRANFTAELKQRKNNFTKFLIFSTLALILLNYSQLPAVVIFANYFAITTFFAWLSYQFSLPISYNLIWQRAK